ncbi:MAG TPA: DUF1128 domain-containing protein [Bacillales bacterium]|nr:DUF1128 domain-containing protein [Bacillales bacterium]
MNLSEKNEENIQAMINGLKEKLQLVNQDVLQADKYDVEQYEPLKDVYEWVMSKPNLTVSEKEAILSELGQLRSK